MTSPASHLREVVARLVEQSLAGEVCEDDFRTLYEEFYGRVWCSFPRGEVTREERHELTQEVFFVVYKSLSGCPLEAYDRWIHRIAKNMFLTWRKSKRRLKRSGEEVSLAELPDGDARLTEPAEVSALRGILDEERARLLRSAIGELPEKMRQCVLLRVTQDLKIGEIAVALRIAPGTVKAHLHQAKEKLRHRLAADFDGVDF